MYNDVCVYVVVVDSLVLLDDITENIEGMEEWVQVCTVRCASYGFVPTIIVLYDYVLHQCLYLIILLFNCFMLIFVCLKQSVNIASMNKI